MKSSESGFTLIELLVVISIIGMLSAVILSSLGNARAAARDATRLQEVHQLIVVIQSYENDNAGAFPSNAGCSSGWCCLGHGTAGTCWQGQFHGSTALDNSLSPKYISKIPDDPLNNTAKYGDAYMYNIMADPSDGKVSPVIHWGIEDPTPTSAKDCDGGLLGTWGTGGNGGGYFCELWLK